MSHTMADMRRDSSQSESQLADSGFHGSNRDGTEKSTEVVKPDCELSMEQTEKMQELHDR